MNSTTLAKNIYDKAKEKNKQAWLSEKQASYIFSLLEKEGRLQETNKKHYIAHIFPGDFWIQDPTLQDVINVGEENVKRVYIVQPPFYIRREGFKSLKITIQ